MLESNDAVSSRKMPGLCSSFDYRVIYIYIYMVSSVRHPDRHRTPYPPSSPVMALPSSLPGSLAVNTKP